MDIVDFSDSDFLCVYLHHEYYYEHRIHMFDVRRDELGAGGRGDLFENIEGALIHGSYIADFENKFSAGNALTIPPNEYQDNSDYDEYDDYEEDASCSDDSKIFDEVIPF